MKSHTRKLLLFLIDFAIMLLTLAVGLLFFIIRGEHPLGTVGYVGFFFCFAIGVFACRFAFGIYGNVWRYADHAIYSRIVIADAVGGSIGLVISNLPFCSEIRLNIWQAVSFVAVCCIATLLSRFVYRIKCEGEIKEENTNNDKACVAIIGAGKIGNLLVQELKANPALNYRPVCFIDKDPSKVGSKILGLPVYSENDALSKLTSLHVKEVFFAIPEKDPENVRLLREKYAGAGYAVKLYDFPIKSGEQPENQRVIRDIKIEDLLFRNSIKVVDDATRAYYSERTVLITGGGGSIGSEICRRIASCEPKKLIIFDIYENNAYDIQQELIRKYGIDLDLSVEIGSVRDRKRLEAVFRAYRPEIVIHAAAHKHVPLMEHSNCEAIKNNVFGTYNTADMAEKYGVEKFILISTDKAVNPTNVMGASKRLCEMVIQCRNDSETAFCAVRFGNVLGSNGSVIPLFKRQIEAGGPITITDKRIIRYFMTIPEATGLVMQAGAMAKCGELFVLDMGKPVKILDLAENMIRLSGLTPYRDIDIKEIGLRPGEKLYEELLIKTEKLTKTKNDLIFIENDTPLTRSEMESRLDVLRNAVQTAEMNVGDPSIKSAIKSVVPTYKDPEEVNAEAEKCEEMKTVVAV